MVWCLSQPDLNNSQIWIQCVRNRFKALHIRMNVLIEDDCVQGERFQGGCLTAKMEIEGGLADKHRKLSAAEVFRGISRLEHKLRGYLLKFRDKPALRPVFFPQCKCPSIVARFMSS